VQLGAFRGAGDQHGDRNRDVHGDCASIDGCHHCPPDRADHRAVDGAENRCKDFDVVKVTVLETKIPIAVGSHAPGAGNQWAGVLAQTCIQNSAQPTVISWRPWNLESADGSQYPAAESKYEDTPKPEYPFAGDATYVNGDCAKGWIIFEIPTTAKPSQVRYSVADPTFGSLLGRWSISS
jgi:hypothetical protein